MSISENDVTRVARLARVHIGPEEITRYREALSEILNLVTQLHLSDTEGVEPIDRKSTRLNSSHSQQSRMPSSA